MADVPSEVVLALVGLVAVALPSVIGSIVWALKSAHRQNDAFMKHNEKMRMTLENHLTATAETLGALTTAIMNHSALLKNWMDTWETRWEVGKKEGAVMWKGKR